MSARRSTRHFGSSGADELSPRDDALEYWFCKFQSAGLAFLVDFIVRRTLGQAEVRLSLWVDGRGRVEHAATSTWSANGERIQIGESEFRFDGSMGAVADIRWDLVWIRGDAVFDTRPAIFGRLRPGDMDLTASPEALFSGRVGIGSRTFAIADARGAVYHYGGRRLADRWAWISASEFEGDPDLRLEAYVGSSRLWGFGRLPHGVGYLWLSHGGRSEFILSPVNGLIRYRREGSRITLDGLGLAGHHHRLRATAEPGAFNDLGEGIRQTLLADLELDGVQAMAGSVGLEFRDPP